MTRDEALAIVHRMTAAWPSPPIPEPTARLWVEYLRRQDYATTRHALDGLIGHEQRIPTIAVMQAALRRAHQAHMLDVNTRRALTGGDRTAPDIAIRTITRIRTMLATIGDPCAAARRHEA